MKAYKTTTASIIPKIKKVRSSLKNVIILEITLGPRELPADRVGALMRWLVVFLTGFLAI